MPSEAATFRQFDVQFDQQSNRARSREHRRLDDIE